MKRIFFFISIFISSISVVVAADPTATDYTFTECQGTAIPYPTRTAETRAYPDTLTPIYLNHVGRHGSRFLSSKKHTAKLLQTLHRADSIGSITPMGRELISICNLINNQTASRWGALDSLGIAEQRAIASRAFMAFQPIFKNTKVNAIASYIPRSIMSMYEFTHQLTRLNNNIEVYTTSGQQNSPTLRPWLEDETYQAFIDSNECQKISANFTRQQTPTNLARRAVGNSYPFIENEAIEVSLNIFKVLTGCSAMSLDIDLQKYFTLDEINALWRTENLRNYLTYSASTLSNAAPELATNLLLDLIHTTDNAIAGVNPYSAMLRFGHAETLIPLLAIMHIPGCYYMTNYFDTVGLHWRDFYIAPMSANLQIILFRATSGKYYIRVDLNETPVSLIPGRDTIYIPWETAREYLIRCLPPHLRI